MDDMREDLMAAMSDEGDGEIQETTTESEANETIQTAETSAEAAPSTEEGEGTGDSQLTQELDASQDGADAETTAQSDDNAGLKAPIDWNPQEREAWSKVPKNLQEKILSREQDIAGNMQGTQEARQTHDRMSQLGHSYAPMLAAEGVNDPVQAAEALFQTTAILQQGSQQQKAQKIAELINHYGVDINALDGMLVGEVDPQMQQNSQIEQIINQRMQPIDQMMQRMDQNQQYTAQAEHNRATQDVQDFAPQAEFLNDVRMDMADLIDMSAKRGVNMGLEEAYKKACSLNPQIQSVLDQRTASANLTQNNQNIAGKKLAASSLNGRMTGTGNANDPSLDLHGAIEAAWNNGGA